MLPAGERFDNRRLLASTIVATALAAAGPAAAALAANDVAALSKLSIEELANVSVTSVSKRAEPLSHAPASVYVISNEDILRSGKTSLPEVLRLAPNLQVAAQGSSSYGITARGFNHNSGTANKLQVLVDGRSVYTPLYSGVFWDIQPAFLDDIDRIEVISGPAGALWGANAVNGVINITTRPAQQTQGGLARFDAGSLDRSFALRYGGRLGEAAAFRVYGTGARRGPSVTPSGDRVKDASDMYQAGARLDWVAAADTVMAQAGLYDGSSEPIPGAPARGRVGGADAVAHWTHTFAGGSLVDVQASADTN
ncbi:MAG: TonB-dependent receptor plug domain-containing protein, partial [Phenylobacterium sp.]